MRKMLVTSLAAALVLAFTVGCSSSGGVAMMRCDGCGMSATQGRSCAKDGMCPSCDSCTAKCASCKIEGKALAMCAKDGTCPSCDKCRLR